MVASTNAEQAYAHGQPRTGDAAIDDNDARFFKVANPSPFGFISFALAMLFVGLHACVVGFSNSNGGTLAPAVAVSVGGVAQFVAGIMEFRVGNTFGTTFHCSNGAFWLAYALFGNYLPDSKEKDTALGIFLLIWFFLSLIFFVAALRTNIATLVVFGFLAITHLLFAITHILVGHTSDNGDARKVQDAASWVLGVGGLFAIFSALAAFYTGSSGLMTGDTTWVRFPLGEQPHAPKQSKAATAV